MPWDMKGDTLEEVLALLTPCASLSIRMKWLSLPSGKETGDTVPLPPTSPVRSTHDPVHDRGVSDMVKSTRVSCYVAIAYNDYKCTWEAVDQDLELKLTQSMIFVKFTGSKAVSVLSSGVYQQLLQS